MPIYAWPHVLGLDAAAVAVVWQLLAARHFGHIPFSHTLALGLVVWTIYLADRALDARRPPTTAEPLRHQFARRYRPWLWLLILSNALLLWSLGPLPILAALPVAGLVGIYFLVTHGARFTRWPKELAAAVIFALGVSMPLYPFPFTLYFAALCFWNCTAIEFWERGPAQLSPLAQWVALRLRPLAIAAALVCVLGIWLFHPVIQGTLALTFALCALLATLAKRLPPLPLRVLADVALLTPLVWV